MRASLETSHQRLNVALTRSAFDCLQSTPRRQQGPSRVTCCLHSSKPVARRPVGIQATSSEVISQPKTAVIPDKRSVEAEDLFPTKHLYQLPVSLLVYMPFGESCQLAPRISGRK